MSTPLVFALFPNVMKPNSITIAGDIRDRLHSKGALVVAEDDKAAQLNVPPLSSVKESDVNFLISLGGDGTILRVIHKHPHLIAPIIGINLGGLGFMAEVPIEHIHRSLDEILEQRFSIDERIVMEGRIPGNLTCFAVNELVVHRARNLCLVDLQINVGGTYLNTFSADGLIISTPNGSTAYSLAAGGPILTPDLKALVITPICPHTITNRPIVISSSNEIEVTYLSHYEPIEIAYDGFPLHTISTGESLVVKLSPRVFRLVNFDRYDFFSTLRTKLGWAGKLKAVTTQI